MTINEITQFHHCQAIINTYMDEELVKRDGFWFDHIEIKNDSLYFMKDGLPVSIIDQFDEKKLKKEPVFKNFYSLNAINKKIEIYFP